MSKSQKWHTCKGRLKPALHSADSAAILDHGSHIFIWLGREVAAAMPDPSGDGRWTRTTVVCERWATRLAAGRFPVPELVTVTEVRAHPPSLEPGSTASGLQYISD